MVTSTICTKTDKEHPEITASIDDKCTNNPWGNFYRDKSEVFSNYLLYKHFGQKPSHTRILQII